MKMTAFTKVAIYQHILKHIKIHVCGPAPERGKYIPNPANFDGYN